MKVSWQSDSKATVEVESSEYVALLMIMNFMELTNGRLTLLPFFTEMQQSLLNGMEGRDKVKMGQRE